MTDDLQRSGDPGRSRPGSGKGGFCGIKLITNIGGQLIGGRRRHHALGLSFKQHSAYRRLQPGNVLRDGGLRQV
ncbi:hypothetical protein D3C75_1043100 [compost metagenome]